MNKTIKKYWVKALRSGLFRQAHCELVGTTDDGELGYCCLGVLRTVCDLKLKKSINEELLSSSALKLIGLTSQQQQKLAGMNDGDSWDNKGAKSFDQIADYIEKHL